MTATPPDQQAVADVIDDLRRRFAAAGVPTPDVDAVLLVRHVLGWSQARIVTHRRAPLPPAAVARVEALAARRAAREPLQTIVGSVGFRTLELTVRPGVFIPRPETEVLAGVAVERTPSGGVVVEPCTGSGAVACAVAAESAAALVVATDRSADAIALARSNAASAGLAVEVLHGDLFDPVSAQLRGVVDVVVSNPPYLTPQEVAGAAPEVLADPPDALIAGPTGHEVSDRLIAVSPVWLRPGGWLLLEVADVRAAEVAARARRGGFVDVELIADLTGRDRIVAARRL